VLRRPGEVLETGYACSLVLVDRAIILMAIRAVFYFDGGLSDFRMDLLQYLLFTTTLLVYLLIRQGPAPGSLTGGLY
jgi:hypothetical protein